MEKPFPRYNNNRDLEAILSPYFVTLNSIPNRIASIRGQPSYLDKLMDA